jgi:LPXTG-motif cell wall-anchored protein
VIATAGLAWASLRNTGFGELKGAVVRRVVRGSWPTGALTLVVIVLTSWAFGPLAVSEAQQAPTTFSYSPESGPPGTAIQVSGSCPLGQGGRGDRAFVRLARRATGSDTPFDTSVTLPIREDATFSGTLSVPADAPVDDYRLSMACGSGDQLYGPHDGAFQVVPETAENRPVTFDYSPRSGPPGTAIEFDGACPFGSGRGDEAFVRLARRVSGTEEPFDTSTRARVGSDASFSGTLLVPAGAPADDYALFMSCFAGDQQFGRQEWAFQVLAGATPPSSTTTVRLSSTSSTVDQLPRTGTAAGTSALLALGLAVMGGCLLLVGAKTAK